MQLSNCLKFCFILRGYARATIDMFDMIYLDVALLNNLVHRITVSKCCENRSLHKKCHNFFCIWYKTMNRPDNERLHLVLSFGVFKRSVTGMQRDDMILQRLYTSKCMKYTPLFHLMLENQDSSTIQTHEHIHVADLDLNSLIGRMSTCSSWFLSYEQYYNSNHLSIFAFPRFLMYLMNASSDSLEKWFIGKPLTRTQRNNMHLSQTYINSLRYRRYHEMSSCFCCCCCWNDNSKQFIWITMSDELANASVGSIVERTYEFNIQTLQTDLSLLRYCNSHKMYCCCCSCDCYENLLQQHQYNCFSGTLNGELEFSCIYSTFEYSTQYKGE
jgi:hypothetical protein